MKMNSPQDIQLREDALNELITALPFWPYLSAKEQELVRNRLSLVHYQSGQIVHSNEAECLGLVLVASGCLRAYLLSPDGRETVLYHIKSNDFCVLSADCVLDAVSFDTQVIAEEDSVVLVIPVDVFAKLLENNIYVERDTYAKATERFSEVVSGLERLVFLSFEQRLVSFLLTQIAEKEDNTLNMTHEQIAINIGSARETVSRALKIMSAKGWILLSRGQITIKDRAALDQLK